MDALKTKLKGLKTYLVATAALIGLLVGWADGAVTTSDALKQGTELVLAMTFRSALKQNGQGGTKE